MSRCPDKAFLTVGGRRVAALRCQLDAGHDVGRRCDVCEANGVAGCSVFLGLPHSFTLEWSDVVPPPDLPEPDLYDPDERFDVPVEVLSDDELEQAARHADTDRQVDAHREARNGDE